LIKIKDIITKTRIEKTTPIKIIIETITTTGTITITIIKVNDIN
jgi:hypothetical protein